MALREGLDTSEIARRHFESALTQTRASVTAEMEREYETLLAQLKQQGPTSNRPRIGFDLGGNDNADRQG
jgi:transitional endoplasmic reticulum ATPase